MMNNTRHHNEFSDFPWKKEDYADKPDIQSDLWGYFAHSTEAYYYLQAYADNFGLNDSFVLKTAVEKIERGEDDKGWIIVTKSGGKITSKNFDGLVMCLGRYQKPINPLVKGDGTGILDNFQGQVMHSSKFESVHLADGKRVLLIGSSVTGCDLACSISLESKCLKVDQSVRHVPYMTNRLNKDGRIVEDAMFTRLVAWLNMTLPESMNLKGFQGAMESNFPLQVTAEMTGDKSLVPDPNIGNTGVSYAHDWVECLAAKKFTLRHGIVSCEGNTVTFSDGFKSEYDLIVCCTGYEMDFSLFPDDVAEKFAFRSKFSQQQEAAVYKWALVPDLPDLAFCGACDAVGSPFPVYELCMRWVSQIFAGKIPRPSEKIIRKGAEDFVNYRQASPGHKGDLVTIMCEVYARELGVAPTMWQVLWNPSKLLTGYLFSSFYRTNPKKDHSEVAVKAKERFEYLANNPVVLPGATRF